MNNNIIIKYGIKHKKGNNDKLRRLCYTDDCIKNAYSNKFHCMQHYNELEDKEKITNEIRNKVNIAKKNEVKIPRKQPAKKIMITDEMEQNSKIINDIKIYVKNNIKYRIDSRNKLTRVCMFDDCTSYVQANCENKYCLNHKNGLDPNSHERLQEKEIRLKKQKAQGHN
ncbi:MAG: hypothetical protein MUO21_05720, partial [Nitrososphaeraceae archaeon]|nr:hypothetical protein [Nitrososphaeraceae archaeon]